MFATLRQSMSWLHTWAGVVLGGVLMVMFFMGTLSVFDREIDRWMMPATRLTLPVEPLSIDALRPAIERVVSGSPHWSVVPPNAREPVVRVGFRDTAGEFQRRYLDPRTGDLLPDQGTLGGREFFYPFHYRLHIKFLDIGYWIAGLAAMTMLVLLVSGVIIHARLFREFFTFRPRQRPQRRSLDLHNLTSVLALPFYFMVALSGLIIFYSTYLPAGIKVLYQGDRNAFFNDAFAGYKRPKMQQPGELTSIDAMLIEARTRWGSGEPGFVRVWHPGDAGAYVEVRRGASDRVRNDSQPIYFDGTTGAVLKYEALKPAVSVQRFLAGMHMIEFDHWPLRWLYFLMGLAGCAMIGTGFVLWMEKRRAQPAHTGRIGSRLVAAIACASITGLLLATLAMLVANRLLPLGVAYRAEWEVAVFLVAWIASGVRAWRSPALPWRQQCWTIAALALAAPVLNALTTGDHLFHTVATGRWAVAGVDGVLLTTALISVWIARKLKDPESRRRVRTSPVVTKTEVQRA